jgi:nitrate reductase NapE component
VCGILSSAALIITVLAASVHLDFRNKRSAEQLKVVLFIWPAALLWPIVAVAIPFLLVYTLVVGIYSAFKEF